MSANALYYGDNLDILRKKIKDESVDLCYIDPPFNSKRNYNQIYNNIGGEDRAQAQAFTDTWAWDSHAIAGYDEILGNAEGRFRPQLVDLIKGLRPVLKEESLLAYLVSMALRATEIHRVLKPTGSFYLHCDPTASHYLKVLLDSIFLPGGGGFQNEIIWSYRSGGGSKHHFGRKHDVLLFYTRKKNGYTFNADEVRVPYDAIIAESRRGMFNEKGKVSGDVWDISRPPNHSKEWLGYPTQKPEAVLERAIRASSNEGDTVLDAYCGCGTTVAVAHRLKRKWIGMDITYQSIALILKRLEDTFDESVADAVVLDGVPRDMESAVALAHKKDDRLRKEFEKWVILTYTNNRAVINDKKGADAGIDARAFFLTGKNDNAKIIFQAKSGGVKRGDIATLRGDMGREKAALAVLITLEPPSAPMIREAKAVGQYRHDLMGRSYDSISIVTVQEIVEGGKRLEIPMSQAVLAAAERAADAEQIDLLYEALPQPVLKVAESPKPASKRRKK